MKTGIHGNYFKDVEVNCICGAKFTVNATIPGPMKVETCYQCHPAFNKDKVIKKVIKGRMEKFLEKQKKMDVISKPVSKKKK
ncbi:MAG: 50S ribosomal protein L31 [candidate division SR1 bacterium]|nr:50S ribosomal protein L31 [candidate division SR1 bacterium]